MSSGADTQEGGEGGPLLLNQPIVIDNGTCTIKAGFAGSSKPKVVLGTKVGRPKHLRIMPGGALETDQTVSSTGASSVVVRADAGPSSIYVGRKLDEHRGAFVLEYPMEKGAVNDNGWHAMECLWEHIYSKQCLNVTKQEEHPVLITESPLNSKRNRDRIAEIFFESIRIPALYFSPPAVLSLYASGRTTGVVLDVGDGVAHCVPVYEGYALQHSVTRSDIAGRDVTRQLQHLLRRAGLNLTTTAEADLAKRMKEEICYLQPTPIGAMSSSGGGSAAATMDELAAEKEATTQYQLPDGQTITLSSERYQAPNVLFDPSIMGSEECGVADVLVNSIMKSDIDLRTRLFQQIVLAGGSTLTAGFGDRLLYEVRSRSSSYTRIRISAPPDRLYSCYVGGSILASLATFKGMWVSKEQYDEHGGANILHHREL